RARGAHAPLTAAAPAGFAAAEGTSTGPVDVATFTDANPGEHTADFTATINWGDGTPTSPGTISYDAGSGVYTVQGTHTYAEEGSYPVAVHIIDDGGSTADASLTGTVADAPLTPTGGHVTATETIN